MCLLFCAAAIALRLSGHELPPPAALCCYGTAVLGAAFLLAWAGEALQVDINKGMALALLAFIAVLPEYAVDLYFAWTAARDPTYAQYAAANMTGSNRLLIGVGWSVVALCAARYASGRRRRGLPQTEEPHVAVSLVPGHSIDLVVLSMATLWSLLLPLSRSIGVWHGVGFLLLFAFYFWRISGAAEDEPELAGVAQRIGALPRRRRLTVVALLLGAAGLTLLFAAKPFAESLIGTAEVMGLRRYRFFLVQWLAPLASEAPELLVAVIFASRGHGAAGLSALLSSKVNQWTLLVGTLPMVYSLGRGRVSALPLNDVQVSELLLTAAQSILGVAFLAKGRLLRWEAVALLVLFLIQLPFPFTSVRYGLSVLYVVMGLVMMLRDRHQIQRHLHVTLHPDAEEAREGARS